MDQACSGWSGLPGPGPADPPPAALDNKTPASCRCVYARATETNSSISLHYQSGFAFRANASPLYLEY